MRLFFLAIGLFYTLFADAQKMEKFYDYKGNEVPDVSKARIYSVIEKKDSGWSKMDFYVRESLQSMEGFYKDQACKTEHGFFKYFHPNGMIRSKGYYTDGKKSGTWLSFHSNGMLSDSVTYNYLGWVTGTRLGWHQNGFPSDSTVVNEDGSGVEISWYEDGIPSYAGRYGPGHLKQGKWQYFHRNGKLSSLETYEFNQLVDKIYHDENGTVMADTTNRDRPASFPGGTKAWSKYMEKKIYFPDQYKITNADEATVVVQWAIDEEGNPVDIEVLVPFHPEFDKIALNAIKKSPKWIPAVLHNRKVRYYNRQAVSFTQ